MKINLLILFQFLILIAQAQVEISGVVVNEQGRPVVGANLFIQGSYDGCTSDSLGMFGLKTSLGGSQTLIASYIGFETQGIVLEIKTNNITLEITMVKEIGELDEVVINAGTFEASDEKNQCS